MSTSMLELYRQAADVIGSIINRNRYPMNRTIPLSRNTWFHLLDPYDALDAHFPNEFEISDIFIIKNNQNLNNNNLQDLSNNFVQDKSSFSIKILLNNNFNGGNLIFDDDLIYYLEKGELLIHNGNDGYNFKSIETDKTQYILCGLINIYNK